MIFKPLALAGACLVELEAIADDRGFFARSWCLKTFEESGLNSNLVQCNVSFNKKRGTLRGLHYQATPHAEVKLVRCTRGKIWDVIVDLRTASPTFKRWEAVELTPENLKMLYIPEGFAHGFQTLVDDTEVSYQMSEYYHPECSRGVRYDDPAFAIDWPPMEQIISKRDLNYEPFR